MKQVVVLFVVLLVVWGQTPLQRAQNLVSQMTLVEKIIMVRGTSGQGYAGKIAGVPRLNISAINLLDGPQGVGGGMSGVTCWPSSLGVAASWDTKLMFNWSVAMAEEQKGKGTHVMLGPDINIVRVPMGGRVFEMFSEDPFLTSVLVNASVSGIQSQGIIACAKHFIDNEQEVNRNTINIVVDERTQWEIYYAPFKAAVDAGVGSVMCSYNKINGLWACENPILSSDLKKVMGFKGFVVSDWYATHSTNASAMAGMDMEMPTSQFFGPPLQMAAASNATILARLDDMVTRILYALFSVGVNTSSPTGNPSSTVGTPAHSQLARTLAQNAIVLLKNDQNLLPLSPIGNTFACIGEAANAYPAISGGGSGKVYPSYVITPYDGITNRVGTLGRVVYSSNKSSAANATYAIVFIGFTSTEGSDRASLSLTDLQNSLIAQVAAVNPNTIVVLNGPGAVLMPWINQVKAVLFGFFPGQESGNAIASVLFGDFNPCAKLPISFPANSSDWFSGLNSQYPGNVSSSPYMGLSMMYSEKLAVGYRWYDQQNLVPLFPFGHGLSFTTFKYSNLQISGNISTGVSISLNLQNNGSRVGSEVVQLYLVYPPSAGEPPQVLRGFRKTELAAGASANVNFVLFNSDISIWDISVHAFVPVTGTFNVRIGSSSRDIRIFGTFTI